MSRRSTAAYSPEPVPLRELLAVIAAHEHAARPAPAGLIALTCNEIRRLLTVLVLEPARALACP